MTLSQDDIARLNQELSSLVRAGIPLPEGMREFAGSDEGEKLRSAAERLAGQLSQGRPLSEALVSMQRYPVYYVALIRMGEATGELLPTLERCVREDSVNRTMRRRIVDALLYPIVTICLAIMIVAALVAEILPKFYDIFASLGIDYRLHSALFDIAAAGYPPSTIYGGALLLVVLLLCGVFTATGRRFALTYLSSLPGLAQMRDHYHHSMMFRTLGRLIAGGVSPTDAVAMGADILAEESDDKGLRKVQRQLGKGEDLASALLDAKLVTKYQSRILQRASAGGDTGAALERLADRHEAAFERASRLCISVLEPALLVCVGIFAAYLVISVYMPLFHLPNAIK